MYPSRFGESLVRVGSSATRMEWTEELGPEFEVWKSCFVPVGDTAAALRCRKGDPTCERTVIPPDWSGNGWACRCARGESGCDVGGLTEDDVGLVRPQWSAIAATLARGLQLGGRTRMHGSNAWDLGSRRINGQLELLVFVVPGQFEEAMMSFAASRLSGERRVLVATDDDQAAAALQLGDALFGEAFAIGEILAIQEGAAGVRLVAIHGSESASVSDPVADREPFEIIPLGGMAPDRSFVTDPSLLTRTAPHDFVVVDLTGATVRLWQAGGLEPTTPCRAGVVNVARAMSRIGAGGVSIARLTEMVAESEISSKTVIEYVRRYRQALAVVGLGDAYEVEGKGDGARIRFERACKRRALVIVPSR